MTDMELENKEGVDVKGGGIVEETSYPVEYGEVVQESHANGIDSHRVESGLEQVDNDEYAMTKRGLSSRHLQSKVNNYPPNREKSNFVR